MRVLRYLWLGIRQTGCRIFEHGAWESEHVTFERNGCIVRLTLYRQCLVCGRRTAG